MKIRLYIKYIIWESLYTFITVIFLIALWHLNQILLEGHNEDPFELLAYKDYLPLKFFFMTLFLLGIGVGLIIWNVNRIRYRELEYQEIIIIIVKIIIIVILILFLIEFINNPILKAVATVLCAIVGIGYVATQN